MTNGGWRQNRTQPSRVFGRLSSKCNPPEEFPEVNALPISEITLIIDTRSAKEVCEGICSAFDDSGTARKASGMNQLTSIRLVHHGSMETYVNRALLFRNKCKIAGFEIDEEVGASIMLEGLPGEYCAMILRIENSAKKTIPIP